VLTRNHRSRSSENLEYSISLSKDLSLRISSDTWPPTLLTANLQKGLRLVHRGKELIGEGAGFGVPVVSYGNDTFFSGSSTLRQVDRGDLAVLRKEFLMDQIQRKMIRGATMENRKLRAAWRILDKLYQKHRSLQSLAYIDIAKRMGIKFNFIDADPVGKVVVTYRISRKKINAEADFSLLKKDGLRKIFLLNEQGATFFRKYSDTNGSSTIDTQISAWRNVNAKTARISDQEEKLGFELSKKKGSILHVGREVVNGSADWIGLDYELDCRHSAFQYEIRIMEHEN
jgi:hypothetical protein